MSVQDGRLKHHEACLHDVAVRSAKAQQKKYFPKAEEIVSGCAAFGGDIWTDLAKWHALSVARGRRREACRELAALLEPAVLTKSQLEIEGLYERAILSQAFALPDDLLRCALYEVTLLDRPSTEARAIVDSACASGISRAWRIGRDDLGYHSRALMNSDIQAKRLRCGIEQLLTDSQENVLIAEAQRRLRSNEQQAEPLVDMHLRRFVEDLHRSMNPVLELGQTMVDRGEGDVVQEASAGVVVVRKPTVKLTQDTKKLWESFEEIADKPLGFASAPDRSMTADIMERWPHARDVVETMLEAIVPGAPVRIRPTLLVGAPGSGKTSLLLAIAKALDTPAIVYPCGASADNSFGGTAARWASAGPSVPLEEIRRCRLCNPFVILDEIEKSPSSERYGGVPDTVLPMLEPHTAAGYYEAGLGVTADLSHVSFLATANSLALSAPLRDRFQILRMPDPGRDHVSAISRTIVAELAAERGQSGMIPMLTPDEEEVVAKAWNGGSLRRLRRAVHVLVTLRERLATRQ
jgi:hypothetical protein